MTSTADETAELKLGGEVFKISAFTLDQLQELGSSLDIIGGAGGLGIKLPALRAIIAVAVGKKPDEVGALKMTLVELYDAIQTVMKVTGMEELKNRLSPAKKPGE